MNEAFWSMVEIHPDACWHWTGCKNAKGYGNFRSRSAHTIAYELAKGPLPSGLEIDHLCRNRACVNPDHLEAVSHAENVRRHMATITHCKWGHELSGDNVKIHVRPDGVRRRCIQCCRRPAPNKSEATNV